MLRRKEEAFIWSRFHFVTLTGSSLPGWDGNWRCLGLKTREWVLKLDSIECWQIFITFSFGIELVFTGRHSLNCDYMSLPGLCISCDFAKLSNLVWWLVKSKQFGGLGCFKKIRLTSIQFSLWKFWSYSCQKDVCCWLHLSQCFHPDNFSFKIINHDNWAGESFGIVS